jgi:hypothetical protein
MDRRPGDSVPVKARKTPKLDNVRLNIFTLAEYRNKKGLKCKQQRVRHRALCLKYAQRDGQAAAPGGFLRDSRANLK